MISSAPIGMIALLTRYPVKSMAGECPAEVEVEARGVRGDRSWATYTTDGGIGSGKTTRRFRRVDGLLDFRATLPGPVPVITMPDGTWYRADDPAAGERLTALLGQPLALRPEAAVPHHDDSPVHLVTTAALRRLARLVGTPVPAARFRPNLVLEVPGEDFVEDAWIGRELRLGEEVVLRLEEGMPRCVMIDMPQRASDPDGDPLDRDGRLLKEIARSHDLTFGLQAEVVRPGTVRVGDQVRLR